MINQINHRFNIIADFEDKTLDWKAANVNAYWNKVSHLQNDLDIVLDIPLIWEATNRELE